MSKIWQAEKEYQLTKQKLKKQGLLQGTALAVLCCLNCRPGRRGVPQTKSLIHLLFHMIATFFKIMVIFPVHFSMHFSTSYVLRRDFLTSIIIFHIKLIWEQHDFAILAQNDKNYLIDYFQQYFVFKKLCDVFEKSFMWIMIQNSIQALWHYIYEFK